MTWLTAPAPPTQAGNVAALFGDWVLVGRPPIAEGEHPPAPVSRSANGLDSAPGGTMPRATVDVGGAQCREHVHDAIGAGPWIVTNTTLSFPCSEGGFVTHGTQRLTTDAGSWTELPFATSLPETGGGSAVFGTVTTDSGLIAVGQSNGRAAFWLGTAGGT